VGRARPACYDVGRARRSVADVRLGLGLVVVAAGPGSYDEFAGPGTVRQAGQSPVASTSVPHSAWVNTRRRPGGGLDLPAIHESTHPLVPVNVEQVILGRCFDLVNKLALLRLKR
jgi:hypothetical protein